MLPGNHRGLTPDRLLGPMPAGRGASPRLPSSLRSLPRVPSREPSYLPVRELGVALPEARIPQRMVFSRNYQLRVSASGLIGAMGCCPVRRRITFSAAPSPHRRDAHPGQSGSLTNREHSLSALRLHVCPSQEFLKPGRESGTHSKRPATPSYASISNIPEMGGLSRVSYVESLATPG